MSEVVWSINIMLALLLVGVGVTIYWIFKYDDWNPNPITIDEHTSESISELGGNDSEDKRARIGAESYSH
tara:strand:+ start:652 stop:861 length:210 start_codon:yes stop_codon:yes gene_type:complete